VYDLVDGLPWPPEIGARVYRNRFAREWHGRDDEIVARREELRERTEAAYRVDPEVAAVYMGQSAGAVKAIWPAAEVLRSICDGAEEIIRRRAQEIVQ
jgi:nitronate monooxygenase